MFETFRTEYTPQTLLEATARFEKCNIPWLERDLTKKSYNSGQWRLMEAPLFFLVKNRLLLDPAGNPFLMSLIYDGVKEADFLYARKAPKKEPEWSELPEIRNAKSEEAAQAFEKSGLIPMTDSIYLNTKKKTVKNSLDEKALRKILAGQLGPRMRENFAKHFEGYLRDPKEKWRFGLYAALLMSCFQSFRDEAQELFDRMNESMGGSGAFLPEKINIENSLQEHYLLKCMKHIIHGDVADELHINLSIASIAARKNQGIIFLSRETDAIKTAASHLLTHAAYENVFLAALLQKAKEISLVSTSQIGWVKAFDRTLWYALIQVGRSVAAAEGCGVHSHFICEETMGKSIPVPCVELGVEGLEQEMINEGWLPEKEMESNG